LADEILESKLTLDVDDYVKNANKAEKSIEDINDAQKDTEKQSKTSWHQMAMGIASMITIAKAAFDAISGIVNKMIEFRSAASDQTNAINAVNIALQNTSRYSIENSDTLIRQSKSFEELTNYTDNQILSFQKLLLTFENVGIPIFERTTAAATDMATVLGIDLDSAARMLGRALNDPIQGMTALTRAGIQLSQEKKELIEQYTKENNLLKAQEVILGELESRYKGQAELVRDEVDALTKSYKTFVELVGQVTKPALDGMATFFKGVLDDVNMVFDVWATKTKVAAGTMKDLTNEQLELQKIMLLGERQEQARVRDTARTKSGRTTAMHEIEEMNKLIAAIDAEIKARKELEVQQKKDLELSEKEAAIAKIEEERKKKEADAMIEFRNERRAVNDADEKFQKEYAKEAEKATEKAIELAKKEAAERQAAKTKAFEDEQELARLEREATIERLQQEADDRKKEQDQFRADAEYGLQLRKDIAEREAEIIQKQLDAEEKRTEKVRELQEKLKGSYTEATDTAKQAIADLLLAENKSLAEYGKILTQKLAQRMAAISAEATIEAIFETAKGFAKLATGDAVSATLHFKSAGDYATTAAAAGLGAIASAGAARGIRTPEQTQNTETTNITNVRNEELTQTNTIYISENDYRRYVRDTMLPSIQKELDSGAVLKVVR